MPPNRLAIFAPHPVQYHAGIYRELAKLEGVDATVFYEDRIGLKPVYVKEFKTTVQWDIDLLSGYRHVFLRNWSRKPQGGFFARVNPGIVSVLARGRYDAVLFTGYNRFSEWLIWTFAPWTGARRIFRGEATLEAGAGVTTLRNRLKKRHLARFLSRCDRVLYSCTGNREYFRHYGVPDNKMQLLPCAVDNDYFKNERARHEPCRLEIRRELGIAPDDFVIIFAARMLPLKRDDDLINAVSRIDHRRIVLLFVGDGPARPRAEALAREKGVRAVFTGFANQGEISRYYAISDLFAMLSERDRSPKAMNEAMNFSLPLICTKVTGTAYDLVEDGRNGYMVDTGDLDAIARHIDHLNRHREEAAAMGRRSLEIVERWSFQADALSIRDAVRAAVSARPRGCAGGARKREQ
ncbi:MAG: glycosyltransferase [Kiritimatiellae bacterium]|nr:glycosyltransferase [Kiritimatiellia bacterium]